VRVPPTAGWMSQSIRVAAMDVPRNLFLSWRPAAPHPKSAPAAGRVQGFL
jgi:hypothetical protein